MNIARYNTRYALCCALAFASCTGASQASPQHFRGLWEAKIVRGGKVHRFQMQVLGNGTIRSWAILPAKTHQSQHTYKVRGGVLMVSNRLKPGVKFPMVRREPTIWATSHQHYVFVDANHIKATKIFYRLAYSKKGKVILWNEKKSVGQLFRRL